MRKKTIIFGMLLAFVLGMTSANAATIKAVKVQGNIPVIILHQSLCFLPVFVDEEDMLWMLQR